MWRNRSFGTSEHDRRLFILWSSRSSRAVDHYGWQIRRKLPVVHVRSREANNPELDSFHSLFINTANEVKDGWNESRGTLVHLSPDKCQSKGNRTRVVRQSSLYGSRHHMRSGSIRFAEARQIHVLLDQDLFPHSSSYEHKSQTCLGVSRHDLTGEGRQQSTDKQVNSERMSEGITRNK